MHVFLLHFLIYKPFFRPVYPTAILATLNTRETKSSGRSQELLSLGVTSAAVSGNTTHCTVSRHPTSPEKSTWTDDLTRLELCAIEEPERRSPIVAFHAAGSVSDTGAAHRHGTLDQSAYFFRQLSYLSHQPLAPLFHVTPPFRFSC
jgi:hypothetical protein